MSDFTADAPVVPAETPSRRPPITVVGPVAWLRASLFSSWLSTAVTLALAYLIVRWAIGYQDIVSIANTTLNQTGQAIEGIAIIMGVYLCISLSISLFMNWYNARIALVER